MVLGWFGQLGCAGAGEHITRAMLARAVGSALGVSSEVGTDPHEVLRRVLVDEFWSASLLLAVLG